MKWYEKVDREMELERQKFYDSLNWLEKLADNHWTYFGSMFLVCVFAWGIGLLIGWMIA